MNMGRSNFLRLAGSAIGAVMTRCALPETDKSTVPVPASQSQNVVYANHTGMTVLSMDKALAFWVDLLGFQVGPVTRPEPGFVSKLVGVPGESCNIRMVYAPGLEIELLEYAGPAENQHSKVRSSDPGATHLAFEVRDIHALVAAANSLGWIALSGPLKKEQGPNKGTVYVYIRSLEGLLIELIQKPTNSQ